MSGKTFIDVMEMVVGIEGVGTVVFSGGTRTLLHILLSFVGREAYTFKMFERDIPYPPQFAALLWAPTLHLVAVAALQGYGLADPQRRPAFQSSALQGSRIKGPSETLNDWYVKTPGDHFPGLRWALGENEGQVQRFGRFFDEAEPQIFQ